ncbi:MAG TPA: glycerol-3-phosphate dehydrogenase/oxidase [Candidatus Limnocylindrales bacterium]|nr:glycerol-3-phosphate dehydrogenase/oxidase [Candidatus Limnocylindrales bacterium]
MPTAAFDLEIRRRNLERAAEGVADVVIIGCGITGAGVAREAALRGLATVVLDKGDFASGTSSRSSKLIHGGLRYLAQGDIALVREAARERAVLRRLAPHLARPTTMFIPTASRAGRMKMQAGLWSFEKLAGDQAGEKYGVLDRDEALAAEPGLKKSPLAGAVTFQEYMTDDARLVLETVQSAADHGALAASYAEVVSIDTDPCGLRLGVRDEVSGQALVVRTRSVVNAAGPWFDRVRGLSGAGAGSLLQLTRGIHLVVRSEHLPARHSVVLKSPDGRSTFVVPRGNTVYIGTTDTHYKGDPEEPGVSEQDTDYLLQSVAATFEQAPARSDIVGCWSGVRPLLAQEGKSPSEISRRDEIMIGPGPVVAIAGGKLTTYRRMSERVCMELLRLLGRTLDPKVDSARVPLAGGGEAEQRAARDGAPGLADGRLQARLWETYGAAARDIVEAIAASPARAECLGDRCELTLAEIEHAVRREMVVSLDDLLRRRSRLAMFDTAAAIDVAPRAARVLASLLGWDDARTRQEVERATGLWSSELRTVRGAP